MRELLITGTAKVTKTMLAGIAVSALLLACSSSSSSTGGDGGSGGDGGVPADNCASLAGSYDVTTEIVSTDCAVGLHAITQPITWTFVQTAPSCSFTMKNSIYGSSVYTGTFRMNGTQAKVTWTSVAPPPTVAGYSLTYTSEDLTITPAADGGVGIISGSFAWSSGASCTGTTNVCHGSVASGCLTPN